MTNHRQKKMVNRVDHLGSASVSDLSDQFGVSVETVRRDLRWLEQQGLLKRSHGGAISLAGEDTGLAFGHRQNEHAEDKVSIAFKALELIKPGDVIMLDASSSSWYLAKALPGMNLTVITNSVRVAFELVSKPEIKTLTIGGEYSEKYGAFLGALATEQVANFRADWFFFSCTGYQDGEGVWESNELNAAMKRMMKRQSAQSALLCDVSKQSKTGLVRLCNTDEVDLIISN